MPEFKWIVRSSPKVYDLQRSLQNLKRITWTVPRTVKNQVKSGQSLLFALGGKNASLLGYGEIVSSIEKADESPDELEFYADKTKNKGVTDRVFIAVTECFETPIPLADIKQETGLEGMDIFTGYQRKSWFKVEEEEAELLLAIVKKN